MREKNEIYAVTKAVHAIAGDMRDDINWAAVGAFVVNRLVRLRALAAKHDVTLPALAAVSLQSSNNVTIAFQFTLV